LRFSASNESLRSDASNGLAPSNSTSRLMFFSLYCLSISGGVSFEGDGWTLYSVSSFSPLRFIVIEY
jgi:hypothetical protein